MIRHSGWSRFLLMLIVALAVSGCSRFKWFERDDPLETLPVEAMYENAKDSLRAGNNLVIFPEGTRTPADGSLRLQRGAANIAVRGGFALTPVVIRCEPPTLRKGDKWYQVPVRRPRYVIDVREDIDPARLAAPGADDAMAVRAVTLALTDYFSREIRRAGA